MKNRDYWPLFWADEATNIFDTLDATRVENKASKKLWRQIRFLKSLAFFVDPDNKLDRYMTHRAHFRVIVHSRGQALIQLRQQDKRMMRDPWFEDQFTYAYPDPAVRWPKQHAAYEELKVERMGLKIEDTVDTISEKQLERRKKRDRAKASTAKLEEELRSM